MEPQRWTEANRANWNDRARVHLTDPGEFYHLAGLRAGGSSLLPLERELLGEVRGLRLLHLMCHLGTESISWARAGAEVTAVDLSPTAIECARELARECGVRVSFQVGDVYALPPACAGPFDVIAMTYGVLCWLRDMPALLRLVAARLAPGGRFLLIDGHPLADQLPDQPGRDGWRLLPNGYFHDPEPLRLESHHTYTGSGTLAHSENYQWSHHLGEILQATIDAGLVLRAVREETIGFYQRFAGMTRRADGYWDLPPGAPQVPMLFALLAQRPGA